MTWSLAHERHLHADDDSFPADGQMAEATDLAHGEQLPGPLLEAAEQEHPPIRVELRRAEASRAGSLWVGDRAAPARCSQRRRTRGFSEAIEIPESPRHELRHRLDLIREIGDGQMARRMLLREAYGAAGAARITISSAACTKPRTSRATSSTRSGSGLAGENRATSRSSLARTASRLLISNSKRANARSAWRASRPCRPWTA